MARAVIVAGVGMTAFAKPGQSANYDDMGAQATIAALEDAGIDYKLVEQAHTGWVYGDTPSGQQALYKVGLTRIPVTNLNNACATGSTALYLAAQAIESGAAECALALGFEQMARGALDVIFTDRPSAMGMHDDVLRANSGYADDVLETFQYFALAGSEYADRYGMDPSVFAEVTVKARRHAANNPLAIFKEQLSAEQVLASPPIFGPLTRLQCCPPTCGAAAAVLVSEDFARKHGISTKVELAAQSFLTDGPSSFEGSMMKVCGFDLARDSARAVYEKAGIGPEDIDVVELHDCFTTNEIISYEALGLCPEGGAEKFIRDGDNSYGGKIVTNPSGGLLSKGHPLGATGLAQCAELTWQLRGQAGARQVEGARVALQHNLGLGSVCVVGLYRARH